jgi:hypothetical protein
MAEKDDFGFDRRKFLAYFSSIGLGGTLLPGMLWGQAQQQAAATGAVQFYPEMIGLAARVADVPLSADAQKRIADNLNRRGGLLANYEQLRNMKLGNDTPPAYIFNPVLPGMKIPAGRKVFKYSQLKVAKPKTDEDLAFLSVTHLAHLIKSRTVKSADLTKLYLERLKKFDPRISPSSRRPRPMPRSPPENIAARSTASPGAQRTFSRSKATRRLGAPRPSRTRRSTPTRPSSRA